MLLTSISTSAAGSPYPGESIDRLEILNDGGAGPYTIAQLKVYETGDPGFLVATGILVPFARKAHPNWTIHMTADMNAYHLLHNEYGSPIKPYSIWDDAHHSTTSGRLRVYLPRNAGLKPGDVTDLVVNSGNTPILIDAR